jgi:hypothetical protein
MSSANLFSYSIIECGTGCKLWKFDFEEMFGAAASVQNLDIVGNTIKTCSLASCNIPSKFVHRQLGDVPVVAPSTSTWGSDFEEK